MNTSKDLQGHSNVLPTSGHAKVKLAVQTTVPGSLHAFFKGQLAWLELHDLEVHAVSAPGEELKWVSGAERVMTHAIPMTRSFSPFKDLPALLRLVRLYRQFTIVHAFTPKGGFLGMLAATIARCPVRLFTLWGLAAESVGFRVRLMLWADRVSCALAHRVYVECSSIAELAVQKGICPREKLRVVPAWSTCSLDEKLTDLTDLVDTRAAARREWRLPDNAVVLGFVGRVVRDKGIRELIDAFEKLAAEFSELHLLVVGIRESEDPVGQDTLHRMDQHPRIRCTGFQKDVRPLLCAMDFLAHPSYREGLPTAPLEAAALGLPVIATRIPGCVDAVRDEETGLLVAPRDAKALADAMRRYLLDPQLRRLHGQRGRNWVLHQYDRHKAWAALLVEYNQLLGKRRMAPTSIQEALSQP
jgi:glycosyltransferase involved in cell wall biosynthesis